MGKTLEEMRTEVQHFYEPPVTPSQANPLSAPKSVQVVGRTGGFIIWWSPVPESDGYQIAIMTNQNLAAPDRGIDSVWGGQNTRYKYLVGDVTRYFAVRAVRGNALGPYSLIVNSTSIAGNFIDDSLPAPLPAISSGNSETGSGDDFGWSYWWWNQDLQESE